MELNEINVKIEITAEDCVALMYVLKYFKKTAEDFAKVSGDSELARKIVTRILRQAENALADSKDVRMFLAKKEESERELMNYANELIKRN